MKRPFLMGLGACLLNSALSFAQPPLPSPPAIPDAPAATKAEGQTPAKLNESAATTPDPVPVLPDQLQPAKPQIPPPQPLPTVPPLPAGAGPAVPAAFCPPPRERTWGSTEFLIWWFKNASVDTPLITAATDPLDPTAGSLGSAHTAVLLGGQNYNTGAHFGGRFTLGAWLDTDSRLGIEGTYLFVISESTSPSVSSNGTATSPIIGLPYRDVADGLEKFAPLTIPGLQAGHASLSLSDQIQGGEINAVARFVNTDRASLCGLLGFRYLNFTENLDFQFDATRLPGAILPGATFGGLDHFGAHNDFFGGQVGLRGEYRFGNLFINATGKFAWGEMQQSMDINGGFVANAPNFPPATFKGVGGFFALPTNIGHYSHNVFAVVPEGDINIGYDFNRRVRATVGYTFLYLSNVERPGTAIQHTINTSVSPGFSGPNGVLTGPAAPTFSFSRTDLWVQGINFGLEFKF